MSSTRRPRLENRSWSRSETVDVVEARHEPGAPGLAPDHRGLLAQASVGRVGVLREPRIGQERVERDHRHERRSPSPTGCGQCSGLGVDANIQTRPATRATLCSVHPRRSPWTDHRCHFAQPTGRLPSPWPPRTWPPRSPAAPLTGCCGREPGHSRRRDRASRCAASPRRGRPGASRRAARPACRWRPRTAARSPNSALSAAVSPMPSAETCMGLRASTPISM